MSDDTNVQSEHRSVNLSDAKCTLLAQRLLGACGVGRMAMLGDAPPALLSVLRMACADVRQLTLAGVVVPTLNDGGTDCATVDDNAFESIVLITSHLTPEHPEVLDVLRLPKRARSSVAIVLLGDAAQFQSRGRWESVFIAQGLRKHPLVEVVAPYGTLDLPSELMILLFEPVPAAAAEAYPPDVLIAERDLHTDMTREPGRRSDAHMTRYAQAAQFVRPGDRVLDAACGLGYGAHILLNSSRASSLVGLDASGFAVDYATVNFARANAKPMSFSEGDAEDLSYLEAESIDFAVSVETLEHLHHPETLLGELMRVLTPGGRAYLSVPNNWADETGTDPNPFHHHVYDWPLLSNQLKRCGFLIERAWTQDAGGGQRLHYATRALSEFDPQAGPQIDGEWLLALVMKPPQEFVHRGTDHRVGPNITAFSRDYRNPWLIRSLVSIGLRATSGAALSEMAADTLQSAEDGSADHGAALCVLCYQALGTASDLHRRTLAEQALSYAAGRAGNPTILRWQVSLSYVAGLLYLSEGDITAARAAFRVVTEFDVLDFSPLLGTKTVAAAFRLGMLSIARSEPDDARRWWLHALFEARRLIAAGKWDEVVGVEGHAPETFGLPELATMLQEGSKAVYGLRALADSGGQPGLLWQIIRQAPGNQAESLQLERALLEEWAGELQAGKDWVDAHVLAEAKSNIELSQAKQWLDGQYQALQEEIARLRDVNSESAESHEWLAGQYHSLTAETARQREAIESLSAQLAISRKANADLEKSRQWLEGQYQSLNAEIASLRGNAESLNQQLTESHREKAELEISRQWLEGQYNSLNSEIVRLQNYGESLNAQLTALRAEADELERSRRWLEEQYHLQSNANRVLLEHSHSMSKELVQLSESKEWLAGQYQSLLTANAELLQAGSQNRTEIDAWQKEVRRLKTSHQSEIEGARARIKHLELGVVRRFWRRARAYLPHHFK